MAANIIERSDLMNSEGVRYWNPTTGMVLIPRRVDLRKPKIDDELEIILGPRNHFAENLQGRVLAIVRKVNSSVPRLEIDLAFPPSVRLSSRSK